MTINLIPTEVKFVKLPHYVENPSNLQYGSDGAACFDICAAISEPIVLKAGAHMAVPTGIKTAPQALF